MIFNSLIFCQVCSSSLSLKRNEKGIWSHQQPSLHSLKIRSASVGLQLDTWTAMMLCGEERGGVMWSSKRGEGGRRCSSSSSSLRCPCAPSPVRMREKAPICSSSSSSGGGGGCPLPQPRQLRRSEGNSFGFSPSTLSSGQQRKKVPPLPPLSLPFSFSVSLPFHPLTIWCRCFLELGCYHSQNVSICQCYIESMSFGVVNGCYLNKWLAMIFGDRTKSAQNTNQSASCQWRTTNWWKMIRNELKDCRNFSVEP